MSMAVGVRVSAAFVFNVVVVVVMLIIAVVAVVVVAAAGKNAWLWEMW